MSNPSAVRLALRSRPALCPRPAPRPARQFTSTALLSSRLRQPGEPTGPNEPPQHTTSSAPRQKSPIKVWPILVILAAGTYAFKLIVDQRKGQYVAADKPVAGHSPSRP